MSQSNTEQSILFICFDINSLNEENNKININTEELPENPIRLLEEYFDNHKLLNMEKKELKASEIIYQFNINMPESTRFQLITINNLSYIHEISLDADGFLIFINLEDEKTQEKLEFLIKYITESCCSGETKIYIIGIYKENILPSCQKEYLENIFEEKNLNYDYYEVKYNMNDRIKIHNCLMSHILDNESKNKNKKTKSIKMDETYYEYKLQEIIEKIIINIYEVKMSVIYEPNKKKFVKKDENIANNSNSFCNFH